MNSLQDLVTRAEGKHNPDTWWTEWRGGDDCPVADGVEVQLRYRQGGVLLTEHAPHCDWRHYGTHSDIVGYHVIKTLVKENPANPRYTCPHCNWDGSDDHAEWMRHCCKAASNPVNPLVGGKLSGDHYYRVAVSAPIAAELPPYTAECSDIIEALNMTFNEGEAFKAIWRLAAARQGRGKPGNEPQYDADKAAHYGGRIAVQTRKAKE